MEECTRVIGLKVREMALVNITGQMAKFLKVNLKTMIAMATEPFITLMERSLKASGKTGKNRVKVFTPGLMVHDITCSI